MQEKKDKADDIPKMDQFQEFYTVYDIYNTTIPTDATQGCRQISWVVKIMEAIHEKYKKDIDTIVARAISQVGMCVRDI